MVIGIHKIEFLHFLHVSKLKIKDTVWNPYNMATKYSSSSSSIAWSKRFIIT